MDAGKPAVAIWHTTAASSGTGLTAELAPSSAMFGVQTMQTPAIDVSPAVTYQTIDGFGGAMTDSAAASIAGSRQRNQIMSDLFGPAGAHFTFVRLPIGASDFIADPHFGSYDDLASGTDPSLSKFSVAHDAAATIPLLAEARTRSPQLKLLAPYEGRDGLPI
jgi:glucosylceramidase